MQYKNNTGCLIITLKLNHFSKFDKQWFTILKQDYMTRRLLLLTLIFLFLTDHAFSQFEYYQPQKTIITHAKGERSFALSPDLLINTPNGVQFGGGLKTSYFVSNRISMDADFVFGRKYMHMGPGLIIVPFLLFKPDALSSDIEFESFGDLFLFLAFYALSFEHVAYHLPLGQSADVAPYISLLRLRVAGNEGFPGGNETGTGHVTYATGIELNKYFGRFLLSPYIEYNGGYKYHFSAINLGIYCGISFPIKSESSGPSTGGQGQF